MGVERRHRIATLGLSCVLSMSAPEAAAQPVVCRNTASGASWTLRLDTRAKTVDGFPADFSAETIAWHDARDYGNYTLDRGSGELVAVFPSSTGGYRLVHRCIVHPRMN